MTDPFPINWDLASLGPHPESPAFESLVRQHESDLRSLADEAETFPVVGTTDKSPNWGDFLARFDAVETTNQDLDALISCYAADQTSNKLFQRWEARLSSLSPLKERLYLNIELALKGIDEPTFQKFLDKDQRVKKVQFFLEQRRKAASFRLPKAEELLSAELGVDGIHGWGRLYDRISGDLRIPVMERGAIVEKSPGQIRFDLPDRSFRENNFCAANLAWSKIADTCADALNHIAGTRLTLYKRLGLKDHLEKPLSHNRLRRETLEVMWRTITERKKMLVPYFEKKAKALGISSPDPRLSWFDLHAPWPQSAGSRSSRVPYPKACERIISTFGSFSPEFGDYAKTALAQGWCESENRNGKRQGAFCTGIPGHKQARIFMTYTDSEDDLSTLAHELGHGYHSFVLKDQPVVLQDYPMNLAETASTFAEAVLADQQLTTATPSEQISILDGMMADSVSYLMNIHARFLFEDKFHLERQNGELPATRLDELMLAAQKEAYLDLLDENGWYPGFWVSKLHFYISRLPFYNFPYTFGYLLSLGVYSLGKESKADFPARYRNFLISTGNQETEEAVLNTLGVDLSKPDFWNRSLDVVQSRLDRFLKLIGP